jgi:hypothetical protein
LLKKRINMQALLEAFNTGNFNGIIWSLLMVLVSKYSVEIVSGVIKSTVLGLHYLQDRANATELGKATDIDDRFFTKLEQAVEACMPIADDLKAIAANGKLTPEDIKALQEKAWNIFIDNLGVKDWMDFGLSFVPAFKSKDMTRAFTETSLKKKFDSMHTRALDRVKRSRKLLDTVKDTEELKRAIKSLAKS